MSAMAELKRSDFSKICRTCLLQKDNMEPIYKSDIPKMLLSFTNIKVECDVDEMPKLICQECVTQITDTCYFRETCEKNTSILLKLVTNSTLENDVRNQTPAEEPAIENIIKNQTPSEEFTIKNEGRTEEESIDTFGNYTDLRDAPIYKCEYCARTYAEKKYLNRHVKTHDRGYNCSCKNVPPIEIWEDYLDDNEMSNKRRVIYQCPKCDKTYSEKKYVNRHLKSHKCFCDAPSNFMVTVLDQTKCSCKSVPAIEIWDDYLDGDEDDKRKVIYQCPRCDKSYSERRYVNRHLKSHKCVCNESGNYTVIEIDKTKLIEDKNSVLDPEIMIQNDTKVFQCPICKRIYKERKFYNRHFRTTHSNILTQYPCTQCGQVFKLASSLKRHIQTIHEKFKQVCTICGKLVIHLRLHIRETHNDSERPYKCSLCNSRFTVPSKMRQHIREKHMGLRSYKLCSVCGKKCHSFCALEIHMRSHTGEKPFDCSDCGKKFRNKQHLRDHKLIHTGQRPYICTFCKKGFKTAYALKGHVRIHTGECPYECSVCKRTFIQKSSLNSHMKTHSNNT